MNKTFLTFVLSIGITCTGLHALEHFEAPLPAGGEKTGTEKSSTVNYAYEKMSLQDVAAFYKKEFSDNPDIKWYDDSKTENLVIFDWGNKKWHKITAVNNSSGTGVRITITRDSWTWILGTLIIRFTGVFIVLVILMIALYISGTLFSLVKPQPEKEKK
jgi:hypothetical protein